MRLLYGYTADNLISFRLMAGGFFWGVLDVREIWIGVGCVSTVVRCFFSSPYSPYPQTVSSALRARIVIPRPAVSCHEK